MTNLAEYGWEHFQSHHTQLNTEFKLGRIISIQGFKYHLITERGELEAELSGRLLYGLAPEDVPKVGDWVDFMDYDTMGYIMNMLPRTNELSRKNPGNKNAKQVLAANVDAALIVQGLDRDYNLNRLERYIVQLISCGIKPLVILNKVDLVETTQSYIEEVNSLKHNCPVHFCSTLTGWGIEDLLAEVLQKNKTYILIGSSGVGKSSLLNALMNSDIQKIDSISDFNNKGKHTTTTRDLFRLPNGSLIIDTPGMREFGLTGSNESSDGILFPAIDELAPHCRFADCKHLNESGCAVLAAVKDGSLGEEAYNSYLKLVKEQRRFEIKIEDKKRLAKQFGKMTKEAKAYRKKFKY
jgi:ribosome biogenesis GTPase